MGHRMALWFLITNKSSAVASLNIAVDHVSTCNGFFQHKQSHDSDFDEL